MQAGITPSPRLRKIPSPFRVLASLFILFTLCVFSTGSERRVSGYVAPLVRTDSFPPQDRESRDEIWSLVNSMSLTAAAASGLPRAYQAIELHEDVLSRSLANVPMEFTEAARNTSVFISLPMPDGSFGAFRIEESPVMEAELAAQFPDLKSYRGQGIDDPTATARFDWSPNGFHAIVLSTRGTVLITPYSPDDKRNYISFHRKDLRDGYQTPQCEVTEAMQASSELAQQFGAEGFAPNSFVGATLRTYRLALATTVEYTNNPTYGGSKALTLSKLNTIVNLINAIYEREVSIRFLLVAGELSIIFDVEPDGYTNSSVSTMLNENPTVLSGTIGSSAYDIGHVFGLSTPGSSSGVAQLGVVCGTSKGRGASVLGIALNTGNFTIDSGLVTHEWGHQFGAAHTFNSTSNFCGNAGQRNPSTAIEPGSGSTLMAYPGICSPENLQQNSDSYFHGISFDQIASYSAGSGAACAGSIATGNNPPTVSAGPDFTIPVGTPFTLTASASDPDGDSLTHSWEEFDLGAASPPITDDGTRPIFRSFPAGTSPSRSFPKLSNLLNNTSTIGESLPVTTRAMNFRVTARDNRAGGGGVNSDAMIVNATSSSGPFLVTQPNTAVSWGGGTSQTVTWSVANTSASPVNCASVKISLSTDGGNTFPSVLSASTPNDGTETLILPNTPTSMARIKVEAVGNIFFDISNTNFTISAQSGIQVTVQTNPIGRTFTIDGSTFTSPQTQTWTPGSTHTIATTSPQTGGTGTQFVWTNWSDSGAMSHTVAPATNTTYTANFATQYFLTMNSGAGGTVSPSSGWFSSGQSVATTATPNIGFTFTGWAGSGVGSFSGMNNPASVTMNGPLAETASFGLAAPINRRQFDFDRDTRADIGIYRPSTGEWYIINSSNGTFTIQQWGSSGDLSVPADYDADGKADIAVYRPSTGNWYVINSSNGAFIVQQWGSSGDQPVPADYDGDGRSDFAVYRPSTGNWYIVNSSNGTFTIQQWGSNGDIPVSADYDGDGKADIAVYRPSTGNWYVINSSNGTFTTQQWGSIGDQAVAADYDGDGRVDFGVYRPSTGFWYVIRSSNGTFIVQQWGSPGDKCAPADYDGDGKVDMAVYRPSTGNWYIMNSSNGSFTIQQWGSPDDISIPSSYVR